MRMMSLPRVIERVGALLDALVHLVLLVVDDGQILARESHEAGALALESKLPAGGGLVGIGGTEVGEVRDGAEAHQVLDGLVGGAVFAETDGVVREDEERVDAHQRGHAEGGAAVVGEGEEGGAEGDETAVGGHAIDHRAHAELADAEEDVAASGIDVEAGRVLEDGLGGGGEVGSAAEELGDDLLDGVHDDLAGVAGGDGLVGREDGDLLLPVLRRAWP